MTLVINSVRRVLMVTEKYKALIERFPLVPIKTDAHLDEAHEVAQSLMLRKEPVNFEPTLWC
jgi:hypothetical protein